MRHVYRVVGEKEAGAAVFAADASSERHAGSYDDGAEEDGQVLITGYEVPEITSEGAPFRQWWVSSTCIRGG